MPLRSAGTGFDEEWLAVAAHRGDDKSHIREDLSCEDRHASQVYSYGPDDFSFDLTSSSGISVLSDADPNPSIENEEGTPSLVLIPNDRRRRIPILISFLYERRFECVGLIAAFVLALGISLRSAIGQHGIIDVTSSNSTSVAVSNSTVPTASISMSSSSVGSNNDWGMASPTPSRYISLRSAVTQLSGGDMTPFLSNDTAQHQSLAFLSESDPLRLSPDAPSLAQRYGLAVLYFATRGPGWRNRENWLAGDECEWHGVSCYRDGRTVDDLCLWKNDLNGIVPKEIGLLRGLQRLDLSDNNGLQGSVMSESFGLLPANLRVLHIENCGIVGTIPDTVFNVRYLEILDAGSNQLSGSLPPILGNLVSLTKLYLDHNDMTGALPSEFGNLVLLNEIYLNENRFSGSIPSEIGNMIALKDLSLYSNFLTGTIPKISGEFLEVLYLDDNALEQAIPWWIDNFSMLTDLRLQRNNFQGPVPDLSNLRRLQLLYMQDNDLSGNFPHWLGYLSSLHEIQLFGNRRLTGSIHKSISDLIELRVLHLNDCSLTGTLPRLPPRLEYLDVGNNELLGDLPSSLGDLIEMRKMSMHNCGFTGQLPRIGSLLKLEMLSVDGNFLTGTVNNEIGSLKALTTLRLSSNNLDGGIPSSLGSLPQLEELDISVNAFTGSVPLEICILRDRGELDVLKADCVEVKCECCTSCCTKGALCPAI